MFIVYSLFYDDHVFNIHMTKILLRDAFKKIELPRMRHCPIHLLPPSLPWIGQRKMWHKNFDFCI